MDITVSVDDEVFREASRAADAFGSSVDQMISEYLQQVAGKGLMRADADEWERLSKLSHGRSGRNPAVSV